MPYSYGKFSYPNFISVAYLTFMTQNNRISLDLHERNNLVMFHNQCSYALSIMMIYWIIVLGQDVVILGHDSLNYKKKKRNAHHRYALK
jgi:hypothetical protein